MTEDREKKHKVAIINGHAKGAALAAMAMSVLGAAFATSIVEEPRTNTLDDDKPVRPAKTANERWIEEHAEEIERGKAAAAKAEEIERGKAAAAKAEEKRQRKAAKMRRDAERQAHERR